MINERYFNIGDIVRISAPRIKERIKYIQRESPIPFQEIVHYEDPLNQYVEACIITRYNNEENKTYNVRLLDKNREPWLTVYNVTDEEMYICEDDQPIHFVSKFKPGDRVLVRISYFTDHHLEIPIFFNRYGTISGIKYETGPYGSIVTNASYDVKMDNGIDLTINDPIYLLYDHKCQGNSEIKSKPNYNYWLPYDLLNTHAKDLISDTVNKAKEFIAKEFNIKKEKQMDNMSIDRVIFNDPATIILWKSWHWEKKVDDSVYPPTVTTYKVQDKTVVKCAKGEKFNKYNGFCAAVTKRIFETNSAIQHIIREAQDNSDAKKLVQEITKTGKKVKAQRENMKETKKK